MVNSALIKFNSLLTLQEQFDHTMQLHSPAIQGSALPARLNLEAQILNRQALLPDNLFHTATC